MKIVVNVFDRMCVWTTKEFQGQLFKEKCKIIWGFEGIWTLQRWPCEVWLKWKLSLARDLLTFPPHINVNYTSPCKEIFYILLCSQEQFATTYVVPEQVRPVCWLLVKLNSGGWYLHVHLPRIYLDLDLRLPDSISWWTGGWSGVLISAVNQRRQMDRRTWCPGQWETLSSSAAPKSETISCVFVPLQYRWKEKGQLCVRIWRQCSDDIFPCLRAPPVKGRNNNGMETCIVSLGQWKISVFVLVWIWPRSIMSWCNCWRTICLCADKRTPH